MHKKLLRLASLFNSFRHNLKKNWVLLIIFSSWKAFANDIALKSRDAIRLHQERYNVISHDVVASDNLTDCHQTLLFHHDPFVF